MNEIVKLPLQLSQLVIGG